MRRRRRTRFARLAVLAFLLATPGTALRAADSAVTPVHGAPTERSVDPRPTIRRGQVERFEIDCSHDGRKRHVWVYTPPGYDPSAKTPYPLLFAFDGGDYLSEIPLPLVLDTLLAVSRTPPLVAVLLDDSTSTARLDELANRAWFAKYLSEEVVPWVRAHWRVHQDPRQVGLCGSSAGGLAAAYVALHHPDVFGNAISQSGAFWRGNEASNAPPYEWLTAEVARMPVVKVALWLEVGELETRGALGGAAPSILEANRQLRDSLKRRGYTLAYAEVPNGVHAPESWRERLPGGIEWFGRQVRQ